MSVINALVDAGHSHESELFNTVMQAHNEETTRLRQQLDIALKALNKYADWEKHYGGSKGSAQKAIAQIRELEK